jgi:DNA-binding CsgD family transcriptional regulator
MHCHILLTRLRFSILLGTAMSEIPLSPREKQLLRRLAVGKTDAQIAGRLGFDAERISEQRARLLRKLGIISPAEIAEAAKRLARLITYKGVT